MLQLFLWVFKGGGKHEQRKSHWSLLTKTIQHYTDSTVPKLMQDFSCCGYSSEVECSPGIHEALPVLNRGKATEKTRNKMEFTTLGLVIGHCCMATETEAEGSLHANWSQTGLHAKFEVAQWNIIHYAYTYTESDNEANKLFYSPILNSIWKCEPLRITRKNLGKAEHHGRWG